jgi:hypothetical protein
MLFALRIGPVPTGETPFRVLIGGDENERVVGPVVADNDAEGLRALKAKVQGGLRSPLLCEKALTLAGRANGFEVAEPPAWLLRARAALALVLALGPSLQKVPPQVVLELLDAAESFWLAKPWRHVDLDETLHVGFTAPEPLVFEASILGSGGQEFGVALYEGTGALAKMRRARSAPRTASKVNSIAVTFDPGPAFALDAIKGPFGLEAVPVPLAVDAGRLRPISSSEVLLLATVLRAAASFTGEAGVGLGTTTIGDVTLRAEIRSHLFRKNEPRPPNMGPEQAGLSKLAEKAMANSKISDFTHEDAADMLLATHGCGRKTVKEIAAHMKARGTPLGGFERLTKERDAAPLTTRNAARSLGVDEATFVAAAASIGNHARRSERTWDASEIRSVRVALIKSGQRKLP